MGASDAPEVVELDLLADAVQAFEKLHYPNRTGPTMPGVRYCSPRPRSYPHQGLDDLRPGGRYEVVTLFVPGPDRANNAPYTLFDDSQKIETVRVNQQKPYQATGEALAWASLGSFTVESGWRRSPSFPLPG